MKKIRKIDIEKLKLKDAVLNEQDFQNHHYSEENILLSVHNLKTYFPVYGGIFRREIASLKAVDGVSFNLHQGKTLGLVGESGCGKTTVGRSLVRLYDVTEGDIYYKVVLNNNKYFVNIAKLNKQELKYFRTEIQMIFQDPYSSLNPRFTVGGIIEEPIKLHLNLSKSEIKDKTVQLLEKVGLAPEHYYRYPHEFSGGQRQRIGIARALSINPSIIIADEPVSALDVSVQAQVINLMQDLQDEYELTYIFIAHDLSVVKHISHNIGVMYLGKIVEIGDKNEIYNNPKHPYTKILLSSVPKPEPSDRSSREKTVITGDVPSPINKPVGCDFNTRCPIAEDICFKQEPSLSKVNELSAASCHFIKNRNNSNE